MIRVYNTLSGEKELLPKAAKPLRLFVCGPTVYDYSHIGHARTYLFFDFFVKYLRTHGHEVFYLQNITDIDDKIIKRADEENKEPLELAESFTKIYLDNMKALGIDSVNEYAPATKFIPEITNQVERLIEKGFAYKIDSDGWYFNVAKDDDYGKLSHRTATQAEDAVSRIDDAVNKRNKGDFCLWKFSKPGEPVWKSKLGDGRPGWHIEDTAISEKYFGPQYDIHGGAVDLKFPHHEAEIAQQESASGKKPFVKIWMHTGFLTVNGEKMSKSLKNFIKIEELLQKHSSSVFRMMVLMHHYRSPLDYTETLIETAEKNLSSLASFVAKLEMVAINNKEAAQPERRVLDFPSLNADVDGALSDDLNTPKALAAVFECITGLQKRVWDIAPKDANTFAKGLRELFQTFGISLEIPKIPQEIQTLAAKREKFRTSEQFIQSDALRKEIYALGFIIEDTPVGPFVWPKTRS